MLNIVLGTICMCFSLSRVQLFVTPRTVACQAPLSMEFSRQENWSGLPFPSPEGKAFRLCGERGIEKGSEKFNFVDFEDGGKGPQPRDTGTL